MNDFAATEPTREDLPFNKDGRRRVDIAGVETATQDLLIALGYDPMGEPGIYDTPKRVARYYRDFFQPNIESFTTFANVSEYDETVVCRGLPFASLCEHHLLPFLGYAHVAYKPGEKVAGLSKLGRAVDYFAGQLQLQERLTNEIATYLEENLVPKGVAVMLEAEHMCMSIRGVHKQGHKTATLAVRGCFRTGVEREEVLELLKQR